jgi:F-type H+-transporting ATPase subunit a
MSPRAAIRTVLATTASLACLVGSSPTARASGEGAQHELPSVIDVAYHFLAGTAFGEFIQTWQNVILSLLIAALIILFARIASRNPELQPGKLQNFVELVVEELEKFILGILGPRGKKYVPFLGTLFIYILCLNYSGLVPLLKAPTASINETLALALCVFCYVQYTAVKENGVRGYIDHLMGQPRSAVQWALVWVMVPVHIIGELAKPVSLACRLFGNITGEDVLIFAFVGLGVALTSFSGVPVGIPLQIPFYGLALLLGFVQALVFMLLSTVYFVMVLPHEDETH